MKDAVDSAALERFRITCGNCINNDDGICDRLGYVVDEDDDPHCDAEWELKE